MTAIEIEELARRLAGFTVVGGKDRRGRLVGYTDYDRFLVEDAKSPASTWAYPGVRLLVHDARGGWAVEQIAFVPNVEAWQAGGCVCCGAAERGVKPLAHIACWGRLTEDEKGFVRNVTYKNPHRAAVAKPPSVPAPAPAPAPPTPAEVANTHYSHLDAARRLFTFLAGLQLQDQPVAVQREAAALLHEVGPLLRVEKEPT